MVPPPDSNAASSSSRASSSRPQERDAAASACARAGRRRPAQRLPDRHHGSPLPGPESPTGRAAGRADQREERRCSVMCAINPPRPCASCWKPKSRAVDATLLMESLFKLVQLEVQFSLNMNVLSDRPGAACSPCATCCGSRLDHRKVVLVPPLEVPLEKIEHRLEVLDGYLIAYLNLDQVIRIVRSRTIQKPADRQVQADQGPAEAILNLRLIAVEAGRGRDQGRARPPLQGAPPAQVAHQVR